MWQQSSRSTAEGSSRVNRKQTGVHSEQGWWAERGTPTARWHYQGLRPTRHLLKDQPAERDSTSECSWYTVWWRPADEDQVGLTAGLGTRCAWWWKAAGGGGAWEPTPNEDEGQDTRMSRHQGELPHITGSWASAAIVQELHCSPRPVGLLEASSLFHPGQWTVVISTYCSEPESQIWILAVSC